MKNSFEKCRMDENNLKWENAISRVVDLYHRGDDIRSPFARDYNRILHSPAYRRLKHKTQVFFATTNDHVCTRIEHVNHVTSVSYTISKYLGLNTELTNAIAIGHDLGHTPFGHAGETILSKITDEKFGIKFWHEKNSLRIIDKTETLEDPWGSQRNLNLIYAIRDGIVCHCGEVDENALFPRDEFVNLEVITKANEFRPYTWEGCIVKIADKISFLGRDIEDALALNILDRSQLDELNCIIKQTGRTNTIEEINNTILMHDFIIDLCNNSSPGCGIMISESSLEIMNLLKAFNYKNIYLHKRLDTYKEYASLIINSIFKVLDNFFDGQKTLKVIKKHKEIYPVLTKTFSEWLLKFGEPNERESKTNIYKNKILYNTFEYDDYVLAAVDFISGMTDLFALKIFQELTTF
ncbi:MAG: HD domain-containing protein [Desulfobacterales bacterium]|nr:HD domain-containing protein [Desulfobacterales bacterium]MDD4072314.1 HD domain-containing protein [Desulfobacterales bacterium]MDD4391321.1 HD domain-containing protein [Desulfobacterales bacterium]